MDDAAKPPHDPQMSPLAPFRGEPPAAPRWFTEAMAQEPERTFVTVAGAKIETLAWGERGAPGLLFLHGNSAHADWWSYIAPFFSGEMRVCAISFSGMGASDWREGYTHELCVAEAMAGAEAAGLFEAEVAPVVVAHSFGAVVAARIAAHHGEQIRCAVYVDPPFQTPERMAAWKARREAAPPPARPSKVYPDMATALSRFRFMPPQASDHPYLIDLIARRSLKAVEGGYIWRFDPRLWAKMTLSDVTGDLAAPRCPVGFIHGQKSKLGFPEALDHMWSTAPAGSPVVMVPEAEHHLMVDHPLAFVSALRGLLAGWPG